MAQGCHTRVRAQGCHTYDGTGLAHSCEARVCLWVTGPQVTCVLYLAPQGHSDNHGGRVTRGGTDESPLHVAVCARGSTQLQGGALLAQGSRAEPCVQQCPVGTGPLRGRGTRGWRDMGTGSISHRHEALGAESSWLQLQPYNTV